MIDDEIIYMNEWPCKIYKWWVKVDWVSLPVRILD